MEPDYQNYSLEDLHAASERIDRNKYKERYELILSLIEERQSSDTISKDDQIYLEVSKGFDSKIGCERIILTGVFAGVFVIFSSLILGLGIQDNEYRIDALISVGLYALLTLFLYFKSRTSATLLFAIYFLSHLKMWFIDMQPRGLVTGVILSVVFLAAMLGTFVWHKNYKKEHNEKIVESET